MLIDALLQRSVAHHAGAVAVDDGERRWSYARLADVVARQAARLAGLGVGPGDRVAVLAKNRAEYVALYFSVARLGAVLLPLNWRLTDPELAVILEDAGPVLLLVEDAPREPLVAAFPELQVVRLDELDEDPTGGASAGADLGDGETAVQMYTSGTSGRPKGAMLSHRNCTAMTHAWLLDMRLAPGDRFLQVTPLFHVGGMLMVLSNVATGSTLRLLPEFDPVAAIDALEGEGITHSLMVPAMLKWLLDEPHLVGKSFDHLRLVIYGAAPIPQATLERARAVLACDFLQGYGLTETAGVLLTLTPADHARDEPALLASAGRAAPGCLVRVVDDAGADVAPGEVGEIVARGDNISTGYWNDPEATAEAWARGWFHTGDLARVDAEGYVTVVDRKKDMILVGGENVYPSELELVLSSHPDVAEVAVVGIPHPVWGEEVLALVVLTPGATADDRAWTRHCRASLARFKCPTRFRVIEQLPRNAAGKVLKRELRAPYWQDQSRLV